MDRNLLLAVSLSVAVYAAWFGFLEKRFNPQPAKPLAGAVAPGAKPSAAKPADAASAAPAPAPAAAASAAPEKLDVAAADEVKLGEAVAKIHPRGAAIVSFLFPEPLGSVELVPNPDEGLFATFPELEFKRDASVKNGIVYNATRADGLKITKQFLPGEGTVLPRVRVVALNPTRRAIDAGEWTLTAGPGLDTIETEKKENADLQRALALTPAAKGLNGRIETLKEGTHAGPYRWIGIDNRYFLAALLPSSEHFSAAKVALPPKVTLTAKPVSIPPNGSFTWEVPYYLGAKGHTWLSRYGMGLERSIDFGYFAWIGRKMLEALEWLYGLTGNWGWAILALTLILQVVLFPLTWKSLRAAGAMKKLQPEIAKLQQKYAGDSQKLSAATMELYKTKGANPLGGCLPMLLQMPIFIALFNALRNSWELHGAVWIFWIKDLSAKDPYYVLPIVMGALMFLQSKMNPPAGDPAQQKVMMFMPLIFTFMFMNFPSGLVLYWLTNSLVSTVVQVALKDQLEA
ncbi:MAG: membrane protein insertase YidC [Elusimicrobia bacterium]|nr:membrane protein insertase YidC [Elusimicrobiota bacterium]